MEKSRQSLQASEQVLAVLRKRGPGGLPIFRHVNFIGSSYFQQQPFFQIFFLKSSSFFTSLFQKALQSGSPARGQATFSGCFRAQTTLKQPIWHIRGCRSPVQQLEPRRSRANDYEMSGLRWNPFTNVRPNIAPGRQVASRESIIDLQDAFNLGLPPTRTIKLLNHCLSYFFQFNIRITNRFRAHPLVLYTYRRNCLTQADCERNSRQITESLEAS